MLHRLEQEENKAEAEYDQLMQRLSNPTDRQIAEEAMLEERDHAVVLRTLAGGKIPTPRSTLDSILAPRALARARHRLDRRRHLRRQRRPRRGVRHRLRHGRLHRRQRGRARRRAWPARWPARCRWAPAPTSSSKSQREVYESEIAREQAEIDEDPHEELLELELFYQLKGFSAEEARSMAERLQKEPKQFLRTLVHEELGLNEETFPNPVALDAVGQRVDRDRRLHPDHPVLLHGRHAGGDRVVRHQHASRTSSVGASKSLVTTRSWWASGAEMTVVGIIEAAITYGLGVAFAGH